MEQTTPVINSMQELMEMRQRFLADKTSVSDEEIAAALEFARKSRTAEVGQSKKSRKAPAEAPSLESLFGSLT